MHRVLYVAGFLSHRLLCSDFANTLPNESWLIGVTGPNLLIKIIESKCAQSHECVILRNYFVFLKYLAHI